MIFFIMMGFGTAFILLHFDDRDHFSTGLATIYRVLWSGTLGETFDNTGMLHIHFGFSQILLFLLRPTQTTVINIAHLVGQMMMPILA